MGVKAGGAWRRLLPGDFPPWQAVQPQGERWVRAGGFEAHVTYDLHAPRRRAGPTRPAAHGGDP